MSEYFSFERVIEYFPKLITSFPTTLIIVVAALAVGIVLGIILAFIRIHKIPVLYQLSCVYVSFIRGTPQIIQLFLVYYGMPLLFMNLFGIDLNRVDALLFVIVAYGLNESAFLSEIFRGGLSAIPSGQYEAGYACGLTKIQTFRRVVIPQAARIVLPSVEVGIVLLFQNTSMAASIGVRDLIYLITSHRRKPTRYSHQRQWLRKWWTCWSRRIRAALICRIRHLLICI
ncbi:MAG: amino acid ABC transporter permease [Lachnospiraceae bacterium]|nr:amino acid ABC transporter permease [Lachnospiraceae bacterium]